MSRLEIQNPVVVDASPAPVLAVAVSAESVEPLQALLRTMARVPALRTVVMPLDGAAAERLVAASHAAAPGDPLADAVQIAALADVQADHLHRLTFVETQTDRATEDADLSAFEARRAASFFEYMTSICGDRLAALMLAPTVDDGVDHLKTVEAVGEWQRRVEPSELDGGEATVRALGRDLREHLGSDERPAVEEARHEALRRAVASVMTELLQAVRDATAVDFTRYEAATLLRRTVRRLQKLGLNDPQVYLQRLRASPAEAAALMSEYLVSVTAFFRDPEVFEALGKGPAAALVDAAVARGATELRVWSAGCASGEEAVSLAMLFTEVIEDRVPVPEARPRLRVLATDVSRPALALAQSGVYARGRVEAQVSPGRVERFFEPAAREDQLRLSPELRAVIRYTHHDLLRDAPPVHQDLVSCRNVMIYFNSHTRRAVVPRLRGALREGGVLMLGPTELLLGHELAADLKPIDRSLRLWRSTGVAVSVSTAGTSAATTGADADPPPTEATLRAVEQSLLRGIAAQLQPGGGRHRGSSAGIGGGPGGDTAVASDTDRLTRLRRELQSQAGGALPGDGPARAGGEALELAELEIRRLFDDPQTACLMLDADDRVLRHTGVARRILHIDASDIGRPLDALAHRLLDLPPTAALRARAEPIASLIDDPTGERQPPLYVESAGGDVYRLRAFALPLPGGGVGHLLTLLDETRVNRLRRAAAQRLQELETIYESVGIGLALLGADLRYRSINAEMVSWDGRPVEEIIGSHIGDGLPPGPRDTLLPLLEGVLQTGTPLRDQQVRMQIAGLERPANFLISYLPVKVGDDVSGITVVMRNVTEQLRLEDELSSSRRSLKLSLEAGEFGSWRIDPAKGTLKADDVMMELFGRSEGGGVHPVSGFWAQAHPDDVQHIRERLEASAAPGVLYDAEYRVRLPGGQTRWLGARGDTITDGSGRIHQVGVCWDISGRKEQEAQSALDAAQRREALEDAQQAAVRASRAKSDFLANMSHEIRTPMTAILGYADILKRHLSDPDNIELIDTIQSNGKYLLEIINDILDLAKIESGSFSVDLSEVSLAALVEDVVDLLEVRARSSDLALRVEYTAALPAQVRTDARRLRQVLVNLVGNAIKFTTAGEVVIAVGIVDASVRIEVRDTGIGIGEADQARLFEPFSQADTSTQRDFGGTGLGLAISRRFCKALGGELTVRSRPGEGSVFTVKLPLNEDAARPRGDITPRVRRQKRHKQPVDLTGRTIAVCDDRRDMRTLVQHLVEDAGATTLTAANGRELLTRLGLGSESGESAPVRPDLIILDMQMPVMDGYTAARAIRAAGLTLPIIAVTAHAVHGERELCLAAGCTEYATKPLDGDALLAMLVGALEAAE